MIFLCNNSQWRSQESAKGVLILFGTHAGCSVLTMPMCTLQFGDQREAGEKARIRHINSGLSFHEYTRLLGRVAPAAC
jgi:hypothetical protein